MSVRSCFVGALAGVCASSLLSVGCGGSSAERAAPAPPTDAKELATRSLADSIYNADGSLQSAELGPTTNANYNVFNNAYANSINTTFSTTASNQFMRPTAVLASRLFKVGGQVDF